MHTQQHMGCKLYIQDVSSAEDPSYVLGSSSTNAHDRRVPKGIHHIDAINPLSWLMSLPVQQGTQKSHTSSSSSLFIIAICWVVDRILRHTSKIPSILGEISHDISLWKKWFSHGEVGTPNIKTSIHFQNDGLSNGNQEVFFFPWLSRGSISYCKWFLT